MEVCYRRINELSAIKERSISTSRKLLEYAKLANNVSLHATLIMIWLLIIQVFLGHMLPRISGIIHHARFENTPPCDDVQCDFSLFWPSGLLARARRVVDIYNPGPFFAFRHSLFPTIMHPLNWIYPPPALLPAMLISYLPFGAAFVAWSAILTGLYMLLLRRAGLSWLVILAGILSPAALWNLQLGQFGVITGACLVTGLLSAAASPGIAGMVFSFLVIKPQSALLVPVAMLSTRNWSALRSSAICVAIILLASLLMLGIPAWQIYLTKGLAVSSNVLNAPASTNYLQFGVSVLWMLRSLNAGIPVAYTCQILSAIAAAAITWHIWRRTGMASIDRMALTVFLSLLVTPYGYTDDMVAWSVALACLAEWRGWRIGWLDALFWLWPMLCPIIVMKTGVLLTPVVVSLAIARTWSRAGLPIPHFRGASPVVPSAHG